MKKRNMLTKVAALSMAALMTVTGLPVAGLDGALSAEAVALGSGYFSINGSANDATSQDVYWGQNKTQFSVKSGTTFNTAVSFASAAVSFGAVNANGTGGALKSDPVNPVNGTATTNGVVFGTGTQVVTAAVNGGGPEKAMTLNILPTPLDNSKYNSSRGGQVKIKLNVVKSGAPAASKMIKEGVINGAGATGTTSANVDSIATKSGMVVELESASVGVIDIKGMVDVNVNSRPAEQVDISNPQTYSVVITPKNANKNVQLSGSLSYNIVVGASNLSGDDTRIEGADTAEYAVNGALPADYQNGVKVYYKNVEVKTSAYKKELSGNSNVGTGTLTIKAVDGKGFSGSKTKNFTISPRDIDGHVAVVGNETSGTPLDVGNVAYTGSVVTPDFELYDIDPLWSHEDSRYANAYEPTNSGKMTDFTYDTYPLGGTANADHNERFVKLVKGTDYTITNNGTAKDGGDLIITGRGNYTGTMTLTYRVKEAQYDISKKAVATMKVEQGTSSDKTTLENGGTVAYKGKDITPDITVTYTDKDGVKKDLTYLTDYKVTMKDHKNVGSAKVTIEGIGTYAGKIEKNFTIIPKDINDDTVTANLETTTVEYNGEAQEPKISGDVNDSQADATDAKVEEGKDFDLFYDNNINVGNETATVTLRGKGDYTGTKVLKFSITALQISNSQIKIEDIANEVYDGTEKKPTLDVSFKSSSTGKKTALVEGTDYTVAYTGDIIGTENGTSTPNATLTGIGNYAGNATKNFKIVPAANDLSKATVELTYDEVEYDGNVHTAGIKRVFFENEDGTIKTLTNGTDYTVNTVAVTDAGEYDVIVKGAANGQYGGINTKTFKVTAKEATVDFKLSATKKTYNGKAQTVEVKEVTRDGAAITEDDYTVSGTTKATNAGKNTVTVTLKGNYAGSAKKTWTIAKAKQTIKVSPASKTYKAKKVAKKAQSFTIKVTGAKGTKTFKSSSKKVTVSKAGKVTVKKGTKKGTYKITVSAKATKNYNAAASKTVKVVVK